MFSLCIWNCRTHHAKVLEFKSSYTMTNELDICLPISVMFESINRIRDKMYKQHWSEWCHTSDRRSGQCSILICLNDNCHAAFIHALNCITLHTNCVHIFAMFPIAYDRSWKSRRKSYMRKCIDIRLYYWKTSGKIYMPQVASRNCGNVIGAGHPSRR